MIYKKIEELIGKTPLFEPLNYEKEYNIQGKILAKLEYFNPAGSTKDRAALYMINDAEKKGILKNGATIIEPTSGNTGIGLAAIGASRGYKVILTMPDTMSVERINLLKAYGAEVVLTDGEKGMNGAVEKAEEIHKNTENSFIAGQFVNPVNPTAHYETTGPEIFEDTNGKVDILVAGVGTGGTITGTAKYLKEKIKNIKTVAVEPFNSPLLSKGKSAPHGLMGIGANFVPDALDRSVIDEIVTVKEEEAYEAGRFMAQKEGLLVGITSGAVLFAAKEILAKDENKGKTVVVIMPDTGERYLSTKMFND